ncbi:MAG TPA: symmetrical bis(5'-nucleosyl)-tetraphosphatase [Burkholderiaceae bacterium]|jgi:bis(5'-nucleosyl)-tetraphosphatase (symmetrical)|nr:symmetrical bis(5'-nucleosyl)-tetraphosphatase [Burkholderiaceae bacterium]
MATYAIGDLQGCLSSFRQLSTQLPAAKRYIFVGDLVNRGFESLATLRYVKARVEHGQAVAILGNHDLHLLAAAAGTRPLKDGDTLREVLDAPDREELLAWVRRQPLAHFEEGMLFVHAGVLPQWTVEQTLALAGEVHRSLAIDGSAFLRHMYGDEPRRWSDDLTGNDRLRCAVNALTRLRVLSADGTMNLKHKDRASKATHGDMPWFDHPQRATRNTTIVFGHWSTEGLVARSNVIGLDSGCVWGGKLTAMRLHDRALFQRDCLVSQTAEES